MQELLRQLQDIPVADGAGRAPAHEVFRQGECVGGRCAAGKADIGLFQNDFDILPVELGVAAGPCHADRTDAGNLLNFHDIPFDLALYPPVAQSLERGVRGGVAFQIKSGVNAGFQLFLGEAQVRDIGTVELPAYPCPVGAHQSCVDEEGAVVHPVLFQDSDEAQILRDAVIKAQREILPGRSVPHDAAVGSGDRSLGCGIGCGFGVRLGRGFRLRGSPGRREHVRLCDCPGIRIGGGIGRYDGRGIPCRRAGTQCGEQAQRSGKDQHEGASFHDSFPLSRIAY